MISVGDIVQLRSGGPMMTVVSLETDMQGELESLYCAWYDMDNVPEACNYPKQALRLISPYVPTPADPKEQEERAEK